MIRQRIEELRRALAESPPTPEAHLRLATMLLKCNALREAERELRAAVALDPECAGAWARASDLGHRPSHALAEALACAAAGGPSTSSRSEETPSTCDENGDGTVEGR